MQHSSLFGVMLLVILFVLTTGDIGEKLHYFETLKRSDIHSRTRRSADPNPSTHYQEIRFSTLGRHFHMYLRSFSVLANDVRLTSVGEDGISREFTLDPNQFLKGSLKDTDESEVHAHWEGDALMAEIQTPDDVYTIEPAWRHLDSSSNHTMIAYRRSDMKWHAEHWLKESRCPGGVHEGPVGEEPPDTDEAVEFEQWHLENGPSRVKRQTVSPYVGTRTSCRIMVVADYKFHADVGGGIKHRTASYIIGLMNKVESLYRNTKWDDRGTLTNLGFEIAELKIHEDYEFKTKDHYNHNITKWNTKNLLEAFSKERYYHSFCLAHLFTSQRFDNGVLGLAYIASHRLGTVGGICSPFYRKMSLNTGWSSAKNTHGTRILSQEATLVTSHEFGHNWGSEHDPDTDNCAPSAFSGGKYLMYPYAVSGYESNNNIFSPCSRSYVFKVVKSKGFSCFSERRVDVPFCGNGRIDNGEECDAGFTSVNNVDRCCSSECKLITGAKCSPMNFECCYDNCTMAARDHVCRMAQNDGTCKGKAVCTGYSLVCPEPKDKKDDEKCLDGGICKNGLCQDICNQNDMDPCICTPESGKACYRCCKKRMSSSVCEDFQEKKLPDGRPCYQGYCSNGGCEKQVQDIIQRLFDIIEDITIDKLVAFMRSNIVGTVIVLSLIIWIPASCIFSYFDKRHARNDKKKIAWLSQSNHTLIYDKDGIECRRSNVRKLRHTNSVPRHKLVHMTYSNQSHDRDRETNV